MYRKSFPNLEWLKGRIASGAEWTTCILDVSGVRDYRNDIKGPFSLFTVGQGKEYCRNEHGEMLVEPGMAFCNNAGEHYTLDTLSETSQVFNIHFGAQMTREVASYLHLDEAALLEGQLVESQAANWGSIQLTPNMQQLLNRLRSNDEFVVEQSPEHHYLASHLLLSVMLERYKPAFEQKLRSTRAITRKELLKRLERAVEYMLDNLSEVVSIDHLAQVANLSKFHFIRSFKEVFGSTPHKFLEKLRMEKAMRLLSLSSLSIGHIATDLGFQSPDHFSRTFRTQYQLSPLQYRKSID